MFPLYTCESCSVTVSTNLGYLFGTKIMKCVQNLSIDITILVIKSSTNNDAVYCDPSSPIHENSSFFMSEFSRS